jgi:proteasome alpha subunit
MKTEPHMTEEPYRWLEAVANRREYVREQLRGGSPVFAVSLPDGILLLGVGAGRSKVFELHDRLALAGLGHPADIEKVRQAAIDAAHLEAFTRAPEDVSLRRLVSFGLSPQLKQNFEQLFTAPTLVELLIVELGNDPGQDLLTNLHFDGAFQLQTGGLAVAANASEAEAAAKTWLASVLAGQTDRATVADLLLQAWWVLTENKSFTEKLPTEAERRAGWKQNVAGKSVEVGWLDRSGNRAARFGLIQPFAG